MAYLLDDFADAHLLAQRWRAFSDQVMGGVSVVRAEHVERGGRWALRLSGTVSLERNGGFIQIARAFDDGAIDASSFGGLRLCVCGTPGSYYVHLRTADARAPWQHYAAPFTVTGSWRDVDLPWSAFTSTSLRAPLDVSRLLRLGIVAAKTAFEADVAISRLELVP